MEKQILKLALFVSLPVTLLISGCSLKSNDESTAGIASYVVISGTMTSATSQLLEGSGTVRFQDTLGAVSSNVSVSLSAQLNNTGSNITLVTHASSATLTDGIRISLSRSGLNVTGSMQVNSSSISVIQSPALAILDPTRLQLVLDIRNQSPTRILIWTQGSAYTIGTTNINSSTDVSPALTTSTGLGAYWGLLLTDSKITQASLGSANVTP